MLAPARPLLLLLTALIFGAASGCSHEGLLRFPSGSDAAGAGDGTEKHSGDENGDGKHGGGDGSGKNDDSGDKGKKHGSDGDPDPTGGAASAWVEYGPNATLLARVLVSGGGACPAVSVDGKSVATNLRAPATADGRFPQAVCEALLPPGSRSVNLGTSTVSIPAAPQRILVLGDTGCRIKQAASGKVQTQDCNDPSKGWPFAALAAAAAGLKPDLVIHLGDYHYREFACPSGDAKCAGSPPGDTWDSWNADFFTPARSLLAAAPWIFVRGNHEICARAQEGFFRHLDPAPLSAACPAVSAPYAVPFAGLSFAVLDSSAANPTSQSLAPLGALHLQGAWLVTHRPLWLSDEEAKLGDDDGDNDDEVPGAAPATTPVGPLPGAAVVLTGHRHLFRALTFADQRAPQITLGNGGTKLEGHPSTDVAGTPVDAGSTKLTSAETQVSFGFALFQRNGDGAWTMQTYDKLGAPTGACGVESGAVTSLSCQWPAGT